MKPGLYDEKNELVKTWDELIELGLNIEKSYNSRSFKNLKSSANSVLKNFKFNGTLIIPEGIEKIGSYAFCFANISHVICPESLRFVNCRAFANSYIEKIEFNQKSHLSIEFNAFADSHLKEINFKESSPSIGAMAFRDCIYLKNVYLNNLCYIDDYAFDNCCSLETFNLPEKIEKGISCWQPFRHCINLKEINVDKKCDKYCSIDGILYDKNIINILFYPPAKEEKIYKMPNTIKMVSQHAFFECKNLEKIIFSDKLKCIEESSFARCSNLEKISLPKNLKIIEDYAFLGCTKLKSITIPSSLKNVGDFIDVANNALKSIYVSKEWLDNHKDFEAKFKEYIKFEKNLDELLEDGYSFKEINDSFREIPER